MDNKEFKTHPTFLIRFCNHLKQYYTIFGIVGLVIAGAIGLSLLIGFITFNLIVPIAQLIPPWGYAIIGVGSLPAILALIHTMFETDNTKCNAQRRKINKNYPRFEIKIEKTVYDWSHVELLAIGSWGFSETIAFKSIDNDKVQSVANNWLKNAESIYDKHVGKISGTFTEPLSTDDENQNNESLKQEIEDLKKKVEELSNDKVKSKVETMSELEKQNRENNLK